MKRSGGQRAGEGETREDDQLCPLNPGHTTTITANPNANSELISIARFCV